MNPDTPSSTDLSGLCSILMALTGLGFFVALVCIVFFVVETPSITVFTLPVHDACVHDTGS